MFAPLFRRQIPAKTESPGLRGIVVSDGFTPDDLLDDDDADEEEEVTPETTLSGDDYSDDNIEKAADPDSHGKLEDLPDSTRGALLMRIPTLVSILHAKAVQVSRNVDTHIHALRERIEQDPDLEHLRYIIWRNETESSAPGEESSLLKASSKKNSAMFFPPLIAYPPSRKQIFLHLLCLGGLILAVSWLVVVHHVSLVTVLEFLSIPLVSVIFTYVHIWMALWMTFYPIRFRGCCQLKNVTSTAKCQEVFGNIGIIGWQGIIPFKAEKMARTAVQLMTRELLDTKEVFSRLESTRVAAELEPLVRSELVKKLVEDAAEKYSPSLWRILPQRIKEEVALKVGEESPALVADMLSSIQKDIDDLLDLENVIVRAVRNDPDVMNRIFIRCGKEELAFIRNAGASMGLLFGLAQMILWLFYKNKLVVFPLFGLIVGSLTNYIALTVIFKPVDPVTWSFFGGCTTVQFQGIFLRRQKEVAAEYARIVANELFDSATLLDALVRGPSAKKLVELVQKQVSEAIDNELGKLAPIVRLSLGSCAYEDLKTDFGRMAAETVLPPSITYLENYATEALALEKTLAENVSSLPPKEFERILHPVFEEDEWKLVVLGGFLGVVIGIVQAFLL